jgi:hypothetical protein
LVHWEGYPTEEDTWEPIKNVENAQELIAKFHADHPDKPTPPAIVIRHMHREAKFEELVEHPKLYNYIDGIPGEGFIRPNKLPNIHVIVPLNPQQAENLLHQPLDPLPHLPSETRFVCIYETKPINAITMAIRLNPAHVPLHFYQIINPLDTRTMKGCYEFSPPTKLQYVPLWLNRDYSCFCQTRDNIPVLACHMTHIHLSQTIFTKNILTIPMPGRDILPHDIIVLMPMNAIAAMFNDGIHMFPRPWRYFPPIPPHIRHVWIFEEGEAGITTMVVLDQRGIPACLFYITNILYEEVMQSDYGFYHRQILRILPQHIFCRFHPSDMIRVW